MAETVRSDERALAAHQHWYAGVIARLREHVHAAVPAGARFAVISKGDEALVQLGEHAGWHFPRTETGLYAGFHPADGAHALTQLEDVRAKGAEYLVMPASARWWLDHYPELRAYLEERCSLVVDDPDSCRIYALAGEARAAAPEAAEDLEVAQVAPPVSDWLDALLPPDAALVAIGPAARALDVRERAIWRLTGAETPDATEAVLRDARRHGAGYAVVVEAPAPAGLGRPVASQALAELFDLSHHHDDPETGAPRRRRGLKTLFRIADGRPDAAT